MADPAPPPVPPPAPSSTWPRSLVAALLLMVLGVLALLYVLDPARHAVYPVCLFKKMTGTSDTSTGWCGILSEECSDEN